MSGNLWMFSDQLDDEDALMMQRDFVTYYQGADYYGLGLKVFTRLAHEETSSRSICAFCVPKRMQCWKTQMNFISLVSKEH